MPNKLDLKALGNTEGIIQLSFLSQESKGAVCKGRDYPKYRAAFNKLNTRVNTSERAAGGGPGRKSEVKESCCVQNVSFADFCIKNNPIIITSAFSFTLFLAVNIV